MKKYPNHELLDDKITAVGDMSGLFGWKLPKVLPRPVSKNMTFIHGKPRVRFVVAQFKRPT